MGRTWSAVGRTVLVGTCVGALLAAACGPSTAAPSGNVQQSASLRLAYESMVALERTQRGDDAANQQADGNQPGEGTTTASTRPTSNPAQPSKSAQPGQPAEPVHPANAACGAVTLGASPSSPQFVGVTVVLTGAATGCSSPEFEFWILPPGGKWAVLQSFSPNATASWHTAALAAGTYDFDAWGRQAGSGDQNVHISRIASYNLQASAVCTSVAWNAPTLPSPQSPGVLVGLSGTASGCASPLYQFWIQPAGGAWAILRAYSPSSAAMWDTTGLLTGSYNFDIWVKHSGSTAAWEAHTLPLPAYTLQPAAPCSSSTWKTPIPLAPQAPGTLVTLSGVAGGCPNPQYQFWIQPPGGAWAILQPYGSSSTAVWNTAGATTGTYLFDIWAKQLGSSASWEAHISPNPTDLLQAGSPCTSSTLAFNPASPATAGTSIQLNANSSGCPNPLYEFWVLAPGGAWTILQGYSPSATATWNTPLTTGTYLFDVWVKQAGNAGDWEAHIAPNPTYTLV